MTHDACRTTDGRPTRLAVAAALAGASGPDAKTGLVRLFAPEHGIFTTAPAGAAIDDLIDRETGTRVVSLYGRHRHPDPADLADLDAILIDLRDVGVRCFTYAATAASLIEAAAAIENGPEIIVCDRPNPLGAATAGPPLDPALRSLTAWFDVPFVHGLSIGALLAGEAARAGTVPPQIVPYTPHIDTEPTANWIPPSPALDHPDAVRFYPGLVLLEGTNLDEGRGTTAPFRSVAAPWLDTASLAAKFRRSAPIVVVDETTLTPTVGDYAGRTLPALTFALPPLSGEREAFDGFAFGVRLLCAIAHQHDKFSWRNAAASNDGDGGKRFWIDAILGNTALREAITAGKDADAILARWPY